MNENRVKYYKSNDLFYGHNFLKIENMEIPNYELITINDSIEFYEIKRYFDEGVRVKTWSEENFSIYKSKSEELYKLTLRFFNSLNDNSIIAQYDSVENSYHSEFWILFDICKLYKKISSNVFDQLLHSKYIAPFDIFSFKNIVKEYGVVLRKFILDNESLIDVLLHVYEQDYTKGQRLYLPDELTNEDICSYIEAYIDSEHPNANHLESIMRMQDSKVFTITDEIRLKAKRKYNNVIDEMFDRGGTIGYGVKLFIDPNQKEEKKGSYDKSNNEFCCSYSLDWLLQTLDYPSIMNNFIYIFEFVDYHQMRSLHVSKKSEFSIIDTLLSHRSSRSYPMTTSFNIKNNTANLQMIAYFKFLANHGIRLEDVLKWCFTEYYQNEFNCSEIRVSFPSEGTTYYEKCCSIITSFDSIIKQFSLYVKNGQIDFELLEMSTKPIRFENIPSLMKKKYVYGAGKDFKNLTFLLFSNQCMLTHIRREDITEKNYKCFVELIRKEKVYLSDFYEHEHSSLDYLVKNKLISIDDDGLISLKNIHIIYILKDLYENEVVSQWHYPPQLRECIEELVNKGILVEKSSLLSEPEINYLNYLLNRAEFDNGLEIRNKYIHGIQQVNMNKEEHKHNYLVLLRILVFLAIKINDDLCLFDENKQKYIGEC